MNNTKVLTMSHNYFHFFLTFSKIQKKKEFLFLHIFYIVSCF